MARNYSNTAIDTTLTAGINAVVGSMVVASATGWPAAPFAAVLDPGLVTEEVVQVTVKVGTTFTITRGFDGTTAAAHALGAVVRHAAIAGDFTDLQAADSAESGARAAADALRLLIANYDWSTLPNKPAFGALALLNSITASLINDASADGRSLIMAANYAAMRTLLGLVIGTNVQAFDADLAAIAALVDPNADRILFWDDSAGAYAYLAAGTNLTITGTTIDAAGGVSDGDKGDITVSGSGATWTIDPNVVTYAKMQDISATARILGRTTAGAGDVEELTGAQALAIAGAASDYSPGRLAAAGTTYYALPGIAGSSGITPTITLDIDRYMPIEVKHTTTFDQIVIEVSTASGTGGSTARLALYNADTDWQPTTLIVDAGTVATDSLGTKTASINQTLTPGRYMIAMNASVTFNARGIRAFVPAGICRVGATTVFWSTHTAARAYAAFPGTAAAATPGFGTTLFDYSAVLRISTP